VKFDSHGQNVNAVTELQQVSGNSFVPVQSGSASK
jgi:hypothetical protein